MSDTSLTGDPSRDAYFQMMLSSMLSPQSPMEYSTTKGWLPPDSGTMSQYTNTVQDWMSPDIAALIRAANGMDSGPTTTPSGAARLQAISEMTGGTSWEGLVAKAILDGSSPSEATRDVEEYLVDQGLLSFNDSGERDSWRKTVSSTATDWFDSLVEDKVSESTGNDVDSRLGLPSYGTEFDAFTLNPYLEDASNAFAESRAPALSALKDDRMAALDARMGDTDKYMADAMASYERQLGIFDETSNAERRAAFEREQEKIRERRENLPVYEDMQAQGLETGSGDSWIDLWGAAGGEDPTIYEPLKNDSSPALTATYTGSFSEQETPVLRDVMESEIRRDLAKARNNNAGKDYEMSGETADLVKKAKEDKDAVTREARIAYTLNKFLESKGVSPRSAAARQFLGAGQSLFGS